MASTVAEQPAMPVDDKWSAEPPPPPIAAASSELPLPAPPLWPRCPVKSGGGPSRKAPAVPPPPDDEDAGGVVAEVDPEEQNRINESVWIRRPDVIHQHQHHHHHQQHQQQRQQQQTSSPSSSAVMVVPEDAERPPVPGRARRSSSLNGRRHSNRGHLVLASGQLQTAALPVDLSQDSRIARQLGGGSGGGGSRVCCEHHRKQNQLKQSVQRGHERPSTSSSSSSSSHHRTTPSNLSAVFAPPQRRDASLSTVPLPVNISVSTSTSTSFAANQSSSNHSRLSDMPVAMMQWPITSTPVPSSQASAESLAGGENRVARLDNEYVADPSRTTHRNSSTDDVKPTLDNDVVGGGGVLPADGNSLNASFRLPPGVLNTDDQMLLAYMKMSETLGSKRSPTNARPIHSPASDGPIVCQHCGGCRCKSCADAARRVNDVIDTISCVRPVRRLCCSDLGESGEFDFTDDDRPSVCCGGGSRGRRRRRGAGHVALGVLVAALCLPCLCCYWPMKAGHAAVSACRRRYTGQVGVCQCRSVDGNSNLTV